MRYCGNCGTSFDPAALVGRVCPNCGAPINQTGDIISSDADDITQEPTRQSFGGSDAMSMSSLPTLPEHGFADTHTHVAPSRHISGKLPVMLALIGLALLLVGGSTALLGNATGQIHLPGLPAGDADSSQPTATPSASRAVATNGAHSGPFSTPAGSGSPPALTPPSGTPGLGTATPDTTATATITAAPGQPGLTIAPTTVNNLVCLGSSVKFTVTNTGGGAMTWSGAASRTAYKLSPQSGSLDGGQQQTVTVSGISASGTVTIAAPGAANAPQTFTINCTL